MAAGVAGNSGSNSPSQDSEYQKPSFNIEAPIVALKHSTKGTGFDIYHKYPSDPEYNQVRDKEWVEAGDLPHIVTRPAFREFMRQVQDGNLSSDLDSDELPQYNGIKRYDGGY